MPPSSEPVSPWLVLAAVLLASVAAVMAQFAAPPVMPLLMDAFGIDIAQAGSLMSVFSITGLVLALPAGLILGRFGAIATGVTAMAAVIAGSVLGATTTEYGVLLVTRAVQGLGVGLIGVAAPAVVAATFPPERRGTPMGIWAMWVPIGGILMFALSPVLAEAYGWQAGWWLSAAIATVALVVYAVVLRLARTTTVPAEAHPLAELRLGLSGRDIWLLVAAFALFAMASAAVNTFLPTFLAAERGLDLAVAATLASLVLVGAGAGSVLAGIVSDRIGSRRKVIVGASVAIGVLFLVPFNVGGALLPVGLLALGVMGGAVPSGIFSSVPEVVPEPRLAGAGMAAIMFGQNAGFVLGPLLFAALLPAFGWSAIGTAAMAACLLVAVIASRVRVR
jgi:predicted MFS family arabinose efflux permease